MSLRPVVLAILSKEPNTGYGVGRLLRHELSHIWDARLQQIYGELAKLEAQGLVAAKTVDLPNRPAKKIYSLTPAGQEALDEWLSQRPAPWSPKDDLVVQLFCLERMPHELVIRRLDERREECTRQALELRERLDQLTAARPAQLGQIFTLEAAVARADSQIAWCDKAAASLREGEPVDAAIADSPKSRSTTDVASL